MAVGFTTTYDISAYHHLSLNPTSGNKTLCDKVVSDLWQLGGHLWFPPSIKLTATK